jgi:mono/diheme cytochrome c family protein
MKSTASRTIAFLLLLAGSALLTAASSGWLGKVPDADRKRVNPYAGNSEAAAAGKILFENNCAKCHGKDAGGNRNRPNLRSERIEHATDGELAWLLKNGSLWKGMPSWASVPEPKRWQIIAYLRSLPPKSASGSGATASEEKIR